MGGSVETTNVVQKHGNWGGVGEVEGRTGRGGGGGILVIVHAQVMWTLTSLTYKAGAEHAEFSPDLTRNIKRETPSCALRVA